MATRPELGYLEVRVDLQRSRFPLNDQVHAIDILIFIVIVKALFLTDSYHRYLNIDVIIKALNLNKFIP